MEETLSCIYFCPHAGAETNRKTHAWWALSAAVQPNSPAGGQPADLYTYGSHGGSLFLRRNLVRRTGFEFVSAGFEFGGTGFEFVPQKLSSTHRIWELKSCVSNSIPVETNSNLVCPTQFLWKRTQILWVELYPCGKKWASVASVYTLYFLFIFHIR